MYFGNIRDGQFYLAVVKYAVNPFRSFAYNVFKIGRNKFYHAVRGLYL